MSAEWQEAESLGKFYRAFKKRLEIKGYWVMFGRAICFARVVAARPSAPTGETE